MKRLLCFATEREARQTLRALNTQQASPNLYQSASGDVLITGVGLLNACAATMQHAKSYDEIWNLGIAGALIEGFALGDLRQAGTVCRHLHLPTNLDEHSEGYARNLVPSISLGEGPTLISSDYPLHHRPKNLQADFVDMEGYAIAQVAQRLGKPCFLWKLVSDFSSEGGAKLIREHIDTWSHVLSEIVV